MDQILDFVADNPVETVYLFFATLALIGAVCTYTSKRPSVHTEGPPRTAAEIAQDDDTIPIPRGSVYAGQDLTMRLPLRPVHSHEATVPIVVSTPEESRWPA